MKTLPAVLGVVVLCTLLRAQSHAPEPLGSAPSDSISVLLLTGANNHDWVYTSEQLAQLLAADAGPRELRCDVTVSEVPGEALADAEGLAAYDVVVLDYNGPRWGEPAESHFLDAVDAGLGVVVVHASNNAFPGWEGYERLVARMWREGTGHGRFHPFDVDIVDRKHPVTHAFPTWPGHPDELYHRLVAMHDVPVQVLAEAWSDPETGGSGEREPMVMVGRYGRGRVFHTALGHVWDGSEESRASYADPLFHELLRRGTQWAATGRTAAKQPRPLSQLEWQAGWRPLLDSSTRFLHGWLGSRSDEHGRLPIGAGWSIVDGCLRIAAGGQGGDILSEATYEDFELEFEWMVTPGANSGVKIRVPGDSTNGVARGPEYQVLDDGMHRDGGNPLTSAASLYALFAAQDKPPGAPGRFRKARIVARGDRIEHWLDGRRVLDVTVGSEAWEAARLASKFKDLPDYGRGAGHIVLQDHGDEVWYRDLRIRDWSTSEGDREIPADVPGTAVMLDASPGLAGWVLLGDAAYTGDGTSITGEVTGGAQSFLVTEVPYADFLLELDVKLDVPCNSGIQVRSAVHPETGALSGYQIEIDPSERSWSGGLYDEGRRGWIDDLADDSLARAAFLRDGWNRYRIECVGPSLKVWVNGQPTADVLDGLSLEGVIGLQVHSGSEGKLTWANLQLRDLGQHQWRYRRWEDWTQESTGEARWNPAEFTEEHGHALQATGPGVARLRIPTPFGDGSIRFRYEGDAAPRLRVRKRAEDTPALPDAGLVRESSLTRDAMGGWILQPALDLDGAAHTLEVHAYGDRLAATLDGQSFVDEVGLGVPGKGWLALEVELGADESVTLRGFERLYRDR